ncbi:release factor glutamine methyltransferase [Acidimicrobiaceae bacterium]|nr:release factor glutamine methyltransferase [Acidimicrobiaceae bacterium]
MWLERILPVWVLSTAMCDLPKAIGFWHCRKTLNIVFDLIISNPPYIAVYDASVESVVRDYEPHLALYAGTDGLNAHRQIISQAGEWLVSDGLLVLEIGHDQGTVIRDLLSESSFMDIQIRQDYSQHDRIALARKT